MPPCQLFVLAIIKQGRPRDEEHKSCDMLPVTESEAESLRPDNRHLIAFSLRIMKRSESKPGHAEACGLLLISVMTDNNGWLW